MQYLTKLIILGLSLICYIYCGKEDQSGDSQQLSHKRSHQKVTDIQYPLFIKIIQSNQQTANRAANEQLNSQINIGNQQEYLSSVASTSRDTSSIDTKSDEPPVKKLRNPISTKHVNQIIDEKPGKSSSTCMREKSMSIPDRVFMMVYKFIKSLPEGVPNEIKCFLKFALEFGFMEEYKNCPDGDSNTCFNKMQKLLDESLVHFNIEYLRRSASASTFVCFEVLKSNEVMWGKYLNKRCSSFAPLSCGFSMLMNSNEKFGSLLYDYKVFIQDYSDDFEKILLNLQDEYLNEKTDKLRKDSIIKSVYQLQQFLSIFRYEGSKLDRIYPVPTEQTIILVMTVYYFPIFHGMRALFDQLLLKYMKILHLNHLNVFFDSRLSRAVQEIKHFNLFEAEMNIFKSQHDFFNQK